MTNNKRLIKKLAYLGVLKTEPIESNFSASENDIIIDRHDAYKEKVILNVTTNEELLLMVETEKLKTLKSIKSIVMFYFISTLIGVGIWLIYVLGTYL